MYRGTFRSEPVSYTHCYCLNHPITRFDAPCHGVTGYPVNSGCSRLRDTRDRHWFSVLACYYRFLPAATFLFELSREVWYDNPVEVFNPMHTREAIWCPGCTPYHYGWPEQVSPHPTILFYSLPIHFIRHCSPFASRVNRSGTIRLMATGTERGAIFSPTINMHSVCLSFRRFCVMARFLSARAGYR